MDSITERKLKLTILQLLVDLEVWRNNLALTAGILFAFFDIISLPGGAPLNVAGFGSQAYWKEVKELFFAPTPCETETCRNQVNMFDHS